MVNKFNLLKFIIGTIIMFFSLVFVSLGIDSPWLCILSFIIAPVGIYYFNKKVNLKKRSYYLGLVGIFIVTLIFGGMNLSNQAPVDNGQVVNVQQSKDNENIASAEAEQEKLNKEKLEQEKLEAEKAEQERLEQERLEAEKAEQERLAAEKAEQERLEKERLEQERIAAEQAEQARIAEEARQQQAAEEARRQQESAQQNNVSEMVWLSATGDKYHRINNCGRMNPNNARQVTLQQAQGSYQRCSKCW